MPAIPDIGGRRPRLLVTHPWMGRGGSEATAMWTLQALQDDCELTFATASPMDWAELNAVFGTRVDPARLVCLRAPRLPGVDSPLRLAYAQTRLFQRWCRRLAPAYDLCLSAYNPLDFGRPGVQVIGDFSFSETMRKRLYVQSEAELRHRDGPLRRTYLAFGRALGGPERPLSERGDLVLANSAWSARQLEEHFGLVGCPVLHPPVVLPAPARSGPVPDGGGGGETAATSVTEVPARDPLGFACLGRVVPEKEIERIVAILKAVRAAGPPVTLRLVGRFGDDAYSERIRALVEAEGDWIRCEGFLTLTEKQALFTSLSFALHACRIEAFGIAVAEMASLGCVPLVPDTGGAGEIVPHSELKYGSEEEAVARILALIENPERVAELRSALVQSVARFSPEHYAEGLRRHLALFLSGLANSSVPHEDPSRPLPC